MNSRKRVFMITIVGVLLFCVIAVGPALKRTVTPVHAAPEPPAVAIIICGVNNYGTSGGYFPTGPVVQGPVDVSVPITFTPAIGPGMDCAAALSELAQAGFYRLDSNATGGPIVFSYPPTTTPPTNYVGELTQWTFVRGGGPWNAP